MSVSEARAAVEFDRVSIVFGDRPASALPLMDAGKTRSEVQQACGQILGVHDCSLTVAEGEILVLMGLSGSGKSTLLRGVNALNPVAGETPMLKRFLGKDTLEMRTKFLSTIPMGRFSTPQDLASAALFLCSDEASMITGIGMEIDGGRCI